jgi:hypothetical protein
MSAKPLFLKCTWIFVLYLHQLPNDPVQGIVYVGMKIHFPLHFLTKNSCMTKYGRMEAQSLAILTEVFCGFSQSLQENAR